MCPRFRHPIAALLRLERDARRRRGDGRHAAGPHAGPRLDYRAAARRSPPRPRRLRGAQSLGDAAGIRGRGRDRSPPRSIRKPSRPDDGRRRARARRLRHEPDDDSRGAGGVDHAHPRPGPERAVGGEPDDRRPVVRAANRHGDGRLQRGHERRFHGGVPSRGRDRAAAGLAGRVAVDRWRPRRLAGATGVGHRATWSGGLRSAAGR